MAYVGNIYALCEAFLILKKFYNAMLYKRVYVFVRHL